MNNTYTKNEQRIIWEESLAVIRHALFMLNECSTLSELKEYLVELANEYQQGKNEYQQGQKVV